MSLAARLAAPHPYADLPHARDVPPWSDCGDPNHPEFGLVFARPGSAGGWILSFDRAGLRFAGTVPAGEAQAKEVVLHGRRFTLAGPRPYPDPA